MAMAAARRRLLPSQNSRPNDLSFAISRCWSWEFRDTDHFRVSGVLGFGAGMDVEGRGRFSTLNSSKTRDGALKGERASQSGATGMQSSLRAERGMTGTQGTGASEGSDARQYVYSLRPSSRSCIHALSITKLPKLGSQGTPKYVFCYRKGVYRLLRVGPHSCLLPWSSVRTGAPLSTPEPREAQTDPQNEASVATEAEREHVGVHYVRHGREFLLGVAGTRSDVEKIKARIAQFLRTDLHLEAGLTSHVHIQSGSVLFLGTRVAGVLEERWRRRYSKELEKRRRSKARVQRMAEVRTETWHNELKELSLRAWAFGLKKTKKELQSWEAAKQAMHKKAQDMSRHFVFDQIERGVTQQALQRLLDREEEVFCYDAPGTGIPEDILCAHRRLTRLLHKYLDEESAFEKKAKLLEKSQQEASPQRGDDRSGAIPLQLLAPMELITEKLRKKGILQPSKALPTVLTSMLSSSDEAIVSYFAALGTCLLRYYRCCDNFQKVRRLVDHQVRWSALFTLGSKHGCSAKKIIRTFSRGPKIVNRKGQAVVEFPSSPEIARMGKKFLPNIEQDALDDILRSRLIQLLPSEVKKGPRRVQLRE